MVASLSNGAPSCYRPHDSNTYIPLCIYLFAINLDFTVSPTYVGILVHCFYQAFDGTFIVAPIFSTPYKVTRRV